MRGIVLEGLVKRPCMAIPNLIARVVIDIEKVPKARISVTCRSIYASFCQHSSMRVDHEIPLANLHSTRSMLN